METGEGTSPEIVDNGVSAPEVDTTTDSGPSSDAGVTPAQPTGINPAWTGLRDAIGEDHFETFARPILTDMDRNANNRISALTSQLKGYEPFKDYLGREGMSPEYLGNALEVAGRLQSEDGARELYAFLKERFGEEVAGNVVDGLEQPTDEQQAEIQLPPHIQQQLTQLQNFQEQLAESARQEEFNQQVEAAGKELERETNDFIARNPNFTEADAQDLYRIRFELSQQLQAKGIHRAATVDEAAAVLQQRHNEYAQRFGGPQAPNTLPTTAGGVVAPQQVSTKSMSKQDLENLVAQDLMNAKNQQQ